MIRYISFILITFFFISAHAQVTQTFEDSAWFTIGGWKGQVNDFKITTDKKLQSLGNDLGISSIYKLIQPDSVAQWEIWFKMAFAPSDNNKLRLYILADDSIPGAANAYYLEVGENNNTDAFKFYKQKNGVSTLLAVGSAGALANDPSMARVLLTWQRPGSWTLAADYAGGRSFDEEWTISDPGRYLFSDSAYCILSCIYTSTRKDKFFFDDIYLGPAQADLTPPSIVDVLPDSASVRLIFSEPVDSISATDTENYVISNGVGQPWKVVKVEDRSVDLYLTKPLVTGTFEIICRQLKDLQGNIALNVRASFEYKLLQVINPLDLLITEIMADPSPTVGLPLYEYVELLNTSDHAINLADLTLRFDQTDYMIGTAAILVSPGEYVILCESTAAALLMPYGKVIALPRWPAIRNTNGLLSLWFAGKEIHFVSYDDSWYQDSQKANGGWSLEMINTANHCDQRANWRASVDPAGGTPGKVNAVANAGYRLPLKIDSTVYLDDRHIKVYVNKLLTTIVKDQLQMDPPISYQFTSLGNHLDIIFDQALSSGVIYTLTMSPQDCDGLPTDIVSTAIARVESPEKNDLVINEILFNPVSGGSDYVELYNRSSKIFSLKDLIIRNELNNQERSITASSLVLPGTYWVLSASPSFVLDRYTVDHPDQLISQSLPSLPDDQGQLSLMTASRTLIDSCSYDKTYHDRFLNSQDGVALERIDYNLPPTKSNWHSAAGTVGYGTPTSKNSVTSTTTVTSFTAKQKVFTPDHNGIDDLFYLDYTLPGPGYVAHIYIYDDRGHPIKRLANNLLLAREGSLSWDGLDDRNQLSNTGIYIFRIEAIDAQGHRVRELVTGVLSR